MKIYKYIYYSIYYAKKGDNSIDAIASISFMQTFNIITLLNLFLYWTKLIKDYALPEVYLLILIAMVIVNYFYFIVKKIKKK